MAIGSSAYPDFCMAGKDMDTLWCHLGAQQLYKIQLGNELDGQPQAVRDWQACERDISIEYNFMDTVKIERCMTTFCSNAHSNAILSNHLSETLVLTSLITCMADCIGGFAQSRTGQDDKCRTMVDCGVSRQDPG